MRALLLEVPRELLAERRRRGADVWDEMWEGVLHMVPAPSGEHQRLGSRLLAVLLPIAEAKGLVASYETALYRPGTDQDYRVPDLVIAAPEHLSARGVEGRAELVVEIRSPDDETYEKLGFYAEMEVQELLVVHPDRKVELYRLGEGELVEVEPHSDVLDVGFSRSAWPGGPAGTPHPMQQGPCLQVTWGDRVCLV